MNQRRALVNEIWVLWFMGSMGRGDSMGMYTERGKMKEGGYHKDYEAMEGHGGYGEVAL